MKDFFKYFQPSTSDTKWGICVTTCGRSRVNPNTYNYPLAGHPEDYTFTWENGRILNEYQINFVTEGHGLISLRDKEHEVKPGSIMFLRPGVWHSYKPLYKTGWIENYVGFKGRLADVFIDQLQLDSPVVYTGIREELINTFLSIYALAQKEGEFSQKVGSGIIVSLLGYIDQFRNAPSSLSITDKTMNEVIHYMKTHLDITIDMQQLAHANNLSYSNFRKQFREKSGMAPHQYHLHIKMMKASQLLKNTSKSVKEIAFELGFESVHYFSRLFSQKMGVNPTALRKP